MLNDKELAKLVKKAGKSGHLFLEKYREGFLVSDSFTIFYVNQGQYLKTFKELAAAFMGLPEKAGIRCGQEATCPDIGSMFEKLQAVTTEEVFNSGFLNDSKGSVHERYFVCRSFVMTLNNDFAKVINGNALKARGQNDPLLLYNQDDECEGLILPIKSELEPDQEQAIIILSNLPEEEEAETTNNQAAA